MLTKHERVSNILQKKLLEKTKAVMCFDSNVNRDGMEGGKVARTVVRIKC